MRTWLVAATGVLVLLSAGSAAWAAPQPLADIQPKQRQTQKYTCATGKILQVTYLNAANGQSFALVPVKGQTLLFVSTIAASGVKYQAGSYTWWTKGPRADLYDAMGGADAPPVMSDCVTMIR
ncbi:MliC family protein [Paraburkholderia megapolitana]|uniref:Membrane-bound inhibitor of C-type lysozyme n=1 Tax=Paraburkholderia megapolitana TaxID=420953 RepID=A0A1I3TU60_9BURK|nr:MliC family protein [Paraburkholderia megapolitana]QDQ83351.1 lysozyme inhibitor [Paraburkholderia megapolitana]SFJ74325.1 Membrane-bound inhibitor of C-type lysozyme [Paraburkholderia megapolitana]